MELSIFDEEEDREGRRPEEEWRMGVNARRLRNIRPSQSDDPYYQNVPDGNSENSESSVVPQIHVCDTYHAQARIVFGARRGAEILEFASSMKRGTERADGLRRNGE